MSFWANEEEMKNFYQSHFIIMKIPILLVLTLLSFLPLLSKDAFTQDMSKENIKKVSIERVNYHDYSGNSFVIDESCRGIILIEFNNPLHSWAVYNFDLSSIKEIQYDTIMSKYAKHKLPNEDESYETKYIVGEDTILGDSQLLEYAFMKRIKMIDSIRYIDFIIGQPLLKGKGNIPYIYHYNHSEGYGDDIAYYIRSNDKIMSWTDKSLYRYGLVDSCITVLKDGFLRLNLPDSNHIGNIDSLFFNQILVNGLVSNINELNSFESEQNSPDSYTYECVSGFVIIRDTLQRVVFATGSGFFTVETNDIDILKNNPIINMSRAFILKETVNGKNKHTLFNSKYSKGMNIPIDDNSKFHSNVFLQCAGPGCYTQISDWTYVYSTSKQYILNLQDGFVQEIPKQWKLIKPLGEIAEILEMKNPFVKEHYYGNYYTYSDKFIFLAPKNKIMIFDNGKFYELTKKKIKDFGE